VGGDDRSKRSAYPISNPRAIQIVSTFREVMTAIGVEVAILKEQRVARLPGVDVPAE